jgi:simple sugar transport system ATP-binding protein
MEETTAAFASSLAADRPEPDAKPGEPLIEAVDVSKTFGAVQALRNASLTVRRGDVHALMGDNGTGKSTLVRCFTGVHAPNSGELRFDGKPVHFAAPSDARSLGIETVYQDLALVEDLEVWQNLFMGRELHSGPFLRRGAMRERTDELLRDLLVNAPPSRARVRGLSGGQRQSVAIARAVGWSSALVIMDEPTAALGVQETRAVEGLVDRLHGEGLTVLLISHNVEQVLRMAQRVAVMREGTVVGELETTSAGADDIVALITGAARGNREQTDTEDTAG